MINLLWFEDFFSLFFPQLCSSCGEGLMKNEEAICASCIFRLPLTNFHNDPGNKLARQIIGRFDFRQASAFVYFNKGGMVQNVIHKLKYEGSLETGIKMGYLYGQHLKRSSIWIAPDLIVPVPLHRNKKRKRGYNQSEAIAEGLSRALNIRSDTKILTRNTDTKTQTKKSRFNRYENLKGAFSCLHPAEHHGQHILLVDDVITTGSTLEACSIELLKIPGVTVSIAALAFAE